VLEMLYNSPVFNKLRQQAMDNYSGYDDIRGNYKRSELNSLKFCEAVVRECLMVMYDEIQYECNFDIADKVEKRVKEHFDLKE
jgi:hypothetical protein